MHHQGFSREAKTARFVRQSCNDSARHRRSPRKKRVVTNGFVKKTRKTPRRELARALAFKADWEERFVNG